MCMSVIAHSAADSAGHHDDAVSASARDASAEVICTHFNKCGAEGQKYLDLYYGDAWNYYDVNREGKIDAVGVSQFFRFLTKPLGTIDL